MVAYAVPVRGRDFQNSGNAGNHRQMNGENFAVYCRFRHSPHTFADTSVRTYTPA